MEDIVALYAEIVRQAVPIALVFSFGNIIVGTILRAALGGKMEIR